MKQLSPLDNMNFRVEVQETLRRKLRQHAVGELELITIPITNIYYDRQTPQSFLLTCYFVNYRIS